MLVDDDEELEDELDDDGADDTEGQVADKYIRVP